MKKAIIGLVIVLLIVYAVICVGLYIFQTQLIFLPDKLSKDHTYKFAGAFEELYIASTDGKLLNALHFKAKNPKGVVFYCHGNAGSLATWGAVASTYTRLNYDVFIFDYRSYGKSEGSISNEAQLYADHQVLYDYVKDRYVESDIVVLGYSLGTGFASKLASTNSPRLLILQAPYFSLVDMTKRLYPIAPTSLLKYRFDNEANIAECKMPAVVFHGTKDRVIYYGSAEKLKRAHTSKVELISLEGEGHHGITDNPLYLQTLKRLLN